MFFTNGPHVLRLCLGGRTPANESANGRIEDWGSNHADPTWRRRGCVDFVTGDCSPLSGDSWILNHLLASRQQRLYKTQKSDPPNLSCNSTSLKAGSRFEKSSASIGQARFSKNILFWRLSHHTLVFQPTVGDLWKKKWQTGAYRIKFFFFRRGFQNQLREGDSNQVAPLSVQPGSNRCGNLHSLDQAHQVLNSYPAVPVKKRKTQPQRRMRNRVYRSQTPHRGLSSLPQTEYARVAPPLSTSPHYLP